MIDVTLKVNGYDFSDRISTYMCEHEIDYISSIRTMDGVEHYRGKIDTVVITFTLLPFTEEQARNDYEALKPELFYVEFTDTAEKGAIRTAQMRLTSNLSSAFGLTSVDGNRYYKGGSIVLRQGG